jgi:hypothetical protein
MLQTVECIQEDFQIHWCYCILQHSTVGVSWQQCKESLEKDESSRQEPIYIWHHFDRLGSVPFQHD